MAEEEDIVLDSKQKKEAIAVLKRTPFSNVKIVESHYFNKFGKPRHGVPLEKASKIYPQIDKIIMVTYRNSPGGRKYAFNYRLNKKESYRFLFFIDRKPIELFNVISTGSGVEKKLFKKFGFR